MTVPPTSDPVGIPRAYLGDYEKGHALATAQLLASDMERAWKALDQGMAQHAKDILAVALANAYPLLTPPKFNACQNDFIARGKE